MDLRNAEHGDFVATIPAIPGCMTYSETRAEALADIEDAKSCWVELGERDPQTARSSSGDALLLDVVVGVH